MNRLLHTPRVYYETADAGPPAVPGIRMDVAGFVGISQRGPVGTPVAVESWRQFTAWFGGPTGAGYLAYAVRGFFENGGRRCWVVRVASADPAGGAEAAGGDVTAVPGGDALWRVEASSPGVWGDQLSVTLRSVARARTTIDVASSTPEFAAVEDTSGFERVGLVRITERLEPAEPNRIHYRVVSSVDAVRGRLVWVEEKPERRLRYERPLSDLLLARETVVESVEYSLVAFLGGRAVAVFDDLSLLPEHERYGPSVLSPLSWPEADTRRFRLHQAGDGHSYLPSIRTGGRPWREHESPGAPPPIVLKELREPYLDLSSTLTVESTDIPAPATLRLEGGRDGLQLLRAEDFIGSLPGDGSEGAPGSGIGALAAVDEVSMMAVPDIHIQPRPDPGKSELPPCPVDPCRHLTEVSPVPSRPRPSELPPRFSEDDVYLVQAALVRYCEQLGDRIGLLEPPASLALGSLDGTAAGVSEVQRWRGRFDTAYGALYHPWLSVVDPLRSPSRLTRRIPPTGHVAGQLASATLKVGVHRSAANQALKWVQDVTLASGDPEHGLLNRMSVNLIRPLPGRGIRIMGARTLSSDSTWRFVPVRRLIILLKRALDAAAQWVVFEPNVEFTWARLTLSIRDYLATLWAQGALAGDSVEEAFSVTCDRTTMSRTDIDNGRLICIVRVAPSVPFEFVVLRVLRTGNELEISEVSDRERSAAWA